MAGLGVAWKQREKSNSTVECAEDSGTPGEEKGSNRVCLGGCVVALGLRESASLERISDCMHDLIKVRPAPTSHLTHLPD